MEVQKTTGRSLSLFLIGESDDKWPVDNPPATGAGAEPDVPGLNHIQPEPSVQHLDSVAPGAAAGGDHPAAPAEPDCRRHHVPKERRPRKGQEQKEVKDQEPAQDPHD